jgi:hypothetical protein
MRTNIVGPVVNLKSYVFLRESRKGIDAVIPLLNARTPQMAIQETRGVTSRTPDLNDIARHVLGLGDALDKKGKLRRAEQVPIPVMHVTAVGRQPGNTTEQFQAPLPEPRSGTDYILITVAIGWVSRMRFFLC